MIRLCAWKNMLGVPRGGIHSWRIVGDTAGVDYFGTIVLSMIFTYCTGVPLDIATVGMFLLSIVLHWFFCVSTKFNQWIVGG
jgi:hypothetical protein